MNRWMWILQHIKNILTNYAIIIFPACPGIAAYQIRKQVKRLVIGQFSYNQTFNRLTKSLQDKLYTAMSDRGIQVVERDQLERVLEEQKLGYSGLVNINSAKKIGELLGCGRYFARLRQ